MALTPSGSFLTSKLGPLPVWAWMGLGLGGALLIASYRKGRAAPAPADPLPANLLPQLSLVEGDTIVTVPSSPPGGGRPGPPQPVPIPVDRPPRPRPVPPPPVPVPVPTPKPIPSPTPPAGQWSDPLVKYRTGNELSSLWALAQRYYGNGQQWSRIWNAPQNAHLRELARGDYRNVQPGWRFWIPK